ncbi:MULTISPECIES: TRAP transporter small permease [Halobacillus]|uniref:TRAP-T type transporter subunit DctQ n=1 Tax=Halobacillus halophilus (strain ATCC 35676 / DSM 2266 / JCM 20832 / KCTC 3685 / LMG 17431 / NBRC 102448 / NCIMB 2269) TaxID=866895 RepID=I0JRH3_HALH3|nr:TRAP transporter small permease subunit [Halobacillus halophilus]ASF40717.1 TRAP transporter small permease [Halobacillus halophilus]CCG46744.1 TRAP-T type transporter subunit DctQ [Halobacillus halophilus DSM 2266]
MSKIFANIEKGILVATLALMVVLIFGQVVGRYIFQSAPSWTEEIARYLHIFQVWVGASYAVKMREHIRVDAFVTLFHGVVRKILESASVILWFLLVLFLAVYGTNLVLDTLSYGQQSPAMQIPMWIPMAAVPIGSIGMTIRLAIQLIQIWKGNYDKPKSEGIAT